MLRITGVVVPCLLATWVVSGAAQTPSSTGRPAAVTERSIVDIVHRANVAETQAAQLAAQRSGNERVRAYAARIIADHANTDRQLLKAQGSTARWGLTTDTATGTSAADHGSGSMGATGAIGTTGSSGYAAAGTAGSTGSAAGTAPTTAGGSPSASAPAGSSGGTGSMAATGSIGTTGSAGYARAGETSRDTSSTADDNVQMMTALSSYTGAAFDRAYIDNQVSMHAEMLQHLDKNLIPSARDAQLHRALLQIRASVAEHLRMARDIQKSVGH